MNKARKRTRLLPMLIIQSIAVIISALASFTFMTWLVTDVFHVEDTYAAAGYEILGTLIVFIIVMVPINAVLYTKRNRELSTRCALNSEACRCSATISSTATLMNSALR